MKKWIIIGMCLMVCIFMWESVFTSFEESYIPQSELAVNSLLGRISKIIEKKYNMKPVGTSVAMPGGVVKELGLDFHIKGPLSKDDLRKILINAAQEFLAMVNADEGVKSYLETYPFEINRVDITLFIDGNDRRGVEHPYFGIVGIQSGNLKYWTLETTDDIPSIKVKETETYEEALKKLDNSQNKHVNSL